MTEKQQTKASQTTAPVNGAPAPHAAASSPIAASVLDMIKVSKRTANALRTGIEQGNAAMASLRAAEERLQQARQTLKSVAGTNQGYLIALIEDAGKKPEDFANFGIWEQDGEFYIRATPQGQ